MDLNERMNFADRVIVRSPLCVDRIAHLLSGEIETVHANQDLTFLVDKVARAYKPLLNKYGLSVPDLYWHSQMNAHIDRESGRVLSIFPNAEWADFLNALLTQSN